MLTLYTHDRTVTDIIWQLIGWRPVKNPTPNLFSGWCPLFSFCPVNIKKWLGMFLVLFLVMYNPIISLWSGAPTWHKWFYGNVFRCNVVICYIHTDYYLFLFFFSGAVTRKTKWFYPAMADGIWSQLMFVSQRNAILLHLTWFNLLSGNSNNLMWILLKLKMSQWNCNEWSRGRGRSPPSHISQPEAAAVEDINSNFVVPSGPAANG